MRTSRTRCSATGCASRHARSTGLDASDPGEVLGGIDALKLRSSMTLFARAAPDEPLFAQVLDQLFGGAADDATDARL